MACAVLLVVGVVWVVTTYLTRGDFPIPGIGNWNLAVGAMLAGLGLVAGVVAIVLAIVAAASRPSGPPPTDR